MNIYTLHELGLDWLSCSTFELAAVLDHPQAGATNNFSHRTDSMKRSSLISGRALA